MTPLDVKVRMLAQIDLSVREEQKLFISSVTTPQINFSKHSFLKKVERKQNINFLKLKVFTFLIY